MAVPALQRYNTDEWTRRYSELREIATATSRHLHFFRKFVLELVFWHFLRVEVEDINFTEFRQSSALRVQLPTSTVTTVTNARMKAGLILPEIREKTETHQWCWRIVLFVTLGFFCSSNQSVHCCCTAVIRAAEVILFICPDYDFLTIEGRQRKNAYNNTLFTWSGHSGDNALSISDKGRFLLIVLTMLCKKMEGKLKKTEAIAQNVYKTKLEISSTIRTWEKRNTDPPQRWTTATAHGENIHRWLTNILHKLW